jgi:hypothetical protein
MTLNERIEALVYLGNFLDKNDEALKEVKQIAELENAWFTQESIVHALDGIRSWLHREIIEAWVGKLDLQNHSPKRVGLILAGNIPLVGFHDVLVNFIIGNISVIRFSEKDKVLISKLILELITVLPDSESLFDFSEDFKSIQALIATGSNNSASLFKKYFKDIPTLIRSHRNAVAVINGNELQKELINLGKDVFTYFGLGCRNVSKIYVPRNFVFDEMLGLWHDNYKEMVLHSKYKNNFDYQYAIYLLNQEPFLANGCIILKESAQLSSPIACLFYEFYEEI